MADRSASAPSAEFVALCQTEVAWLREGLGADRSVVYLTQAGDASEPTTLVPVVGESAWTGVRDRANLILPMGRDAEENVPELPEALPIPQELPALGQELAPSPHQVVLPLLHEGLVLGLLVAGRQARDWSLREREQIERAARTLTWACALDRQRLWSERQVRALQEQQVQQRERLHDWLHQVRNPLTALRTFGKLLQKRLQGSRNDELAANLMRESDRLRDLLERADAAIDVTVEPALAGGQTAALLPAQPADLLDMAAELDAVLTSARAIARERGLHFASEVPAGLPPVRGDRQALQEILNNLLDNALKYTPAGGGVGVRAGLERRSPQGDDQQGVAICDNGPGIPVADRGRVFERRYRGVQAAGDLPGTGLGLAIAKELAEQMGGDLELLPSERGATFVLWLTEAEPKEP